MIVKYLSPADDDLPMRESQDYAKDKLRILQGYVYRFTTSMRNKLWRALYFIDLQAGPGKNIFHPSKDIMLGSPLVALMAKYPFTHYRFVELDPVDFDALKKRVAHSPRNERVVLYNDDCNFIIDEIVGELQELDSRFMEGKWPSLNLAFLDPEGLELQWQTVEKLGRVNRMDLIINFSTSGFTRNAQQMFEAEQATKLDLFFGTDGWRSVYQQVVGRDVTHIRRTMLDYYKQRLASLGYVFNFERDILPDEKAFLNRKGAQVYTLMFASKHDLGIKFWNDAIQEVSQPRLL